jgi:UDP-N-acetyl-D-mannosaminuronate dehydrogenase
MKHLVIGVGQIGNAIKEILNCDGFDIKINDIIKENYDVLHICFPYSTQFIDAVNKYKSITSANLIIVHSTVPVGTCEKINAVSSPVRGVHPNLVEGIKNFIKYFGGPKAEEASKFFSDLGIEVFNHPDSKTVEAFKLWDTTIYGFNIILEKEIHRYCKENNVDFDLVYTHSNQSYNDGYEKLGLPQYKKYVLKHYDGKIGGHCVIPNLFLLNSWISDLIKEKNNGFGFEK